MWGFNFQNLNKIMYIKRWFAIQSTANKTNASVRSEIKNSSFGTFVSFKDCIRLCRASEEFYVLLSSFTALLPKTIKWLF